MPFSIFLLAALSGSLYAFGHPNFLGHGMLFCSLASFVFMVALLEKTTTLRQRLLTVFCHQIGFQLAGFYWVPHTLEEFGGLPPGASHLLALGLAPVLSPAWWGYVAWMQGRSHIPGQAQWSPALKAFLPAVLMTALETLIPQQFPVYLGHPWMQFHDWLRLAPFGGVSLYSFFSWWLVFGLQPSLRRQRPEPVAIVGFGLFLVAHLFAPTLELPPAQRQLNVRVVQANVGNFLKMESETGAPLAIQDVIGRYRRLSLAGQPASGLDLVVWPETAFPYSLTSPLLRSGEDTTPGVLREVIAGTSAELLFGGYDNDGKADWSDRFETEYNSAFQIGHDGALKQVYRKHTLIPFGETLPFGPLNRSLSRILPAVSFFARGTEFPVFTTHQAARFVTPICYEILQGGFIARMLRDHGQTPDFIINLTNDSWYGDTAEPRQHLFLAKWRALEFRRPIIRATNTGITTLVLADGSESKRLEVGRQGALDLELNLPAETIPTIYERFGMIPLVALWVLIGLVLTWLWWRQNPRAASRANVRLL